MRNAMELLAELLHQVIVLIRKYFYDKNIQSMEKSVMILVEGNQYVMFFNVCHTDGNGERI